MAGYSVVKGAIAPTDNGLVRFRNCMVEAVSQACREIAIGISSQPDVAFGTDRIVTRSSGTAASLAADAFATSVPGGHANAYARHFMGITGRTTRMDLGNLIEQRAWAKLQVLHPYGRDTIKYRYQLSDPSPSDDLPINYRGAGGTARPDIRVALGGGREAVFDFTTPAEAGHLLRKKIGARTIGTHPNITLAVEILWDDADLYNAARTT